MEVGSKRGAIEGRAGVGLSARTQAAGIVGACPRGAQVRVVLADVGSAGVRAWVALRRPRVDTASGGSGASASRHRPRARGWGLGMARGSGQDTGSGAGLGSGLRSADHHCPPAALRGAAARGGSGQDRPAPASGSGCPAWHGCCSRAECGIRLGEALI